MTESVPVSERLMDALADCKTVLDETDLRHVVEAVLPLVVAEYDRGIETGDYFARQKVANRLGLGVIQP